jgi:transcriptional regulator GlxA family with amidase domain
LTAPIILKAQKWIENNPRATYTVDDVCSRCGVGRRTFERRFNKHTGNSIAEYAQRVKVEYVKKQLETGQRGINEIIYETSYNDINAFRKVFRGITDLSPVEYRKRYAG